MSNILKSFFVVVAVAAVAGGATYAVFSDTDSFVGNTISTAQVNISALSEPMGLLPKPLVASGLIPGQYTGYARGVVYNQANSTNVKLYMYVQNLVGAACPETNIQVWTGHANSGADSERSIVLMNAPLSTYVGSGSRVEITGPGKIFNPTIGPNTSAVIQQRAQLAPTAVNQNASCTWDEVFVAETPAV